MKMILRERAAAGGLGQCMYFESGQHSLLCMQWPTPAGPLLYIHIHIGIQHPQVARSA